MVALSAEERCYYGAGSLWARLQARRPVGRSIYSADWDICIVLDSARADFLQRAWTEGLYLDAGAPEGRAWSRGSITTEWLANTFRTDEPCVEETTYIGANPHSATVFGDKDWLTNQDDVATPYPDAPAADYEDFRACHELWRSHAVEHNAVPPATMADATIEAYRRDGGRVVAHWLQPHEPFLAPAAPLVGGEATRGNVWQAARAGDGRKDIIQSYYANHKYVLQYVAQVIDAVDADILITSDHGSALGEVGVWGHPFGWIQPAVRRVPWFEVAATPLGDYHPDPVLECELEASGVDEQLEALGYR